MSAGVHDAVMAAAEGAVVLLLDGEGVDIGPEGDCAGPWPASTEKAQHAGLANPLVGDIQGVQLPLDEPGGLMFLQSQLGMVVQLPAEGGEMGQQGICGLFGQIHMHNLLS